MAENTQSRAIFISYRRDDSEGEAGRLYDDLVRAYGDDSVFMDVAGIQPGADFRKAIDTNVGGCGVLLAIIGPTWATIADAGGVRRLENTNDYVRLEIASALTRNIPVIPVLVHDAHMPALEQLPDDLKDLRYRNSVELTHTRWNSDVGLLIGALKSYVSQDGKHQTETVHATIPVQLPAPQASEPASPAKKSSTPLFLGIGAAAALAVLAIGLFAYFHSQPAPQPAPQPISTGTTTTTPTPVSTSGTQPQPAPAGPESALLGRWRNSKEPGGPDDLARISVVDFGGKLMVEAWGKCPDHPCDWGSRQATLSGSQAVTDTWQLRNTPQEEKLQRSAMLSLSPSGDGLQVTVKNRFREPNGQGRDSYNQLQFVKVP